MYILLYSHVLITFCVMIQLTTILHGNYSDLALICQMSQSPWRSMNLCIHLKLHLQRNFRTNNCVEILNWLHQIITARIRRLGKVMFSQPCVCPQVWGGRGVLQSLVPGPFWGYPSLLIVVLFGPVSGLRPLPEDTLVSALRSFLGSTPGQGISKTGQGTIRQGRGIP